MFAARLASAALLVALFVALSPRHAAAQASSAQKPFIAIEQDGNMTSSTKNEITFKRAPFSIVVALPKYTYLQARVSTDRRVFDLARSGGSLDESFGEGGGMAEGLRNGDERVFLTSPDDMAFHAWYYESPSDHRLDLVELRPQGVLARRTVSRYSERGGSMQPIDMLPAKELFFVFRLVAGSKEFGRAAIKVSFEGEATSLGSPVVALVGGRPISVGAFKAAYEATVSMKRMQYGALTLNELRAPATATLTWRCKSAESERGLAAASIAAKSPFSTIPSVPFSGVSTISSTIARSAVMASVRRSGSRRPSRASITHSR